MQRIRARTRVDTLANEQRASPARWGRRIYFAILLGLGLLALDWAVGDALILRADGLVVADRSVAAATYAARVSKVLVHEGQRVTAGDVIVELESVDMLRDIAQVSAQNADLATREVQLRTRAVTLGVLVPLAERHARESAGVVNKLDQMTGSGPCLLRAAEPGARRRVRSGIAAGRPACGGGPARERAAAGHAHARASGRGAAADGSFL